MDKIKLIGKLLKEKDLSDGEFLDLLESQSTDEALFRAADQVRRERYGRDVYVRGLIEFTNYCKNNCYYCGIRRDNRHLTRYRLTLKEILACCDQGWELGFYTFVLQGGEDPYYTDEKICEILRAIKAKYPRCVITLSVGEKSRQSYQAYYDAGARRYLLRHETADPVHYGKLHPPELSLAHRMQCLYDLKEIGYQVGAGFMVGSPFQTSRHLLSDLRFLQRLQPDMIGIGPFLKQKDTPFGSCQNGSLPLTLRLLAILRLMFPYVLLPATTALGSIDPLGREKGLKAGANVIMPNLSPMEVRKDYALYDSKICTGEDASRCGSCLRRRIESAGYKMVQSIGNVKK